MNRSCHLDGVVMEVRNDDMTATIHSDEMRPGQMILAAAAGPKAADEAAVVGEDAYRRRFVVHHVDLPRPIDRQSFRPFTETILIYYSFVYFNYSLICLF